MIRPFKAWCRMVLPAVYDDSLTYYEQLCQIQQKLNEVIQQTNILTEYFDDLVQLFEELTEYVNNYFDNLDVQAEIDKKLDEMAMDGTLAEIINQQIFDELNQKVDDNTAAINDNTVAINENSTAIINTNNRIDATITDLENKRYYFGGSRPPVKYGSAYTVRSYVGTIGFAGFRFMGQYLKPYNKTATINSIVVTDINQHSVYTNAIKNSWYANFIVENEGIVSPACVSYTQITAINGNEITLQTYGFTGTPGAGFNFSSINNTDIIIPYSAGRHYGKTIKGLSGFTNHIIVDDIDTLEIGDPILIAPQQDNYVYLNSFYVDTAEIFNIGDDGTNTLIRGISVQTSDLPEDYRTSDSFMLDVKKYVPPFATSVYIRSTETYSTTSTGYAIVQYGIDTSHLTFATEWKKTSTTSDSAIFGKFYIPFVHATSIGYSRTSNLPTPTTKTFYPWGYVEP